MNNYIYWSGSHWVRVLVGPYGAQYVVRMSPDFNDMLRRHVALEAACDRAVPAVRY